MTFPGGVQRGGFGPRAQGGIRGVDFRTQKLTNFDQNSNFSLFWPKTHYISLNLTKLSLNPVKLTLIFEFWLKK